jgi:hypothetical protein
MKRRAALRREQERGFALLLVFVLAAAIALMLYKELPRVAFEAQRNKEDLLIQRGESYQRAIQLFYRKFKKYPAKMEDLDNTNQVRFLRKHYDDPMTGKSEWRLIHIGASGMFTDSLTHKPPSLDKDKDKDKDKTQNAANSFVYEAPSIGSTLADPNQQNPVAPLRASERAGLPPMPGQSPAAQGQPGDPSNPQAGLMTGYPNQPAAYPPGIPGMPQGVNPAMQQQIPNGQQGYGQQGMYPGQAGAAQAGVYPYSTQAGAQGSTSPFAQPGSTTNPNAMAGQNQALNMINQILTTPRANIPQATQPMAGLQITPGIAGVASTAERRGIKIYNEKQKYNEWEFIYDLTKDTAGTTMTTGISGAPQSGAPGQQQGQQGTSPFGSSSFGSSGFGSSAGAAGGFSGTNPATAGTNATGAAAQGATGTTGQQPQQQKQQLSPQEQYQRQFLQQMLRQQSQAQQQQPQPAQPAAPDPSAPTPNPAAPAPNPAPGTPTPPAQAPKP